MKMACTHLHLIFMVTFFDPLNFNTVSSDAIQPTQLHVWKGQSVELTIKTQLPSLIDDFEWIKNNSDIVVSYDKKNVDIKKSFMDKVDFNTENLSLTLKNIQKTDSGLYRARVNEQIERFIAEYNVSVIENHGSASVSIPLPLIIFLSLFTAMMTQ